MSVFGDFQRVWVQRFPDSALPAAWEEDVRANLVKHKQKVSLSAMILPYAVVRKLIASTIDRSC